MKSPSIFTNNNTLTPPFSQYTDGGADYLEHRAKGYQTSVSPHPVRLYPVETTPSGLTYPVIPDVLTHWGKFKFVDDEVKCRIHAMLGRCENGHIFGKEIGCGREWCPDCREEYEARRFSRWLPKAQQIETMAYMVVAPPKYRRPRTKKKLREIRRKVVRGLKYLGFDRGLSRWHWFGDKTHDWYPHLNILLDSGYLPPEKLQAIKEMVARAFDCNRIIVNYQYSDVIARKVHWLKYIVRATFLERDWDDDMAFELYRFNNSHSWGKWGESEVNPDTGKKEMVHYPPVWQLTEGQKEATAVAELEAGTCPCCHTKITWQGGRKGLVRTDCLPAYGFVQMGGGYWMLPEVLSREGWLDQVVVGHG